MSRSKIFYVSSHTDDFRSKIFFRHTSHTDEDFRSKHQTFVFKPLLIQCQIFQSCSFIVDILGRKFNIFFMIVTRKSECFKVSENHTKVSSYKLVSVNKPVLCWTFCKSWYRLWCDVYLRFLYSLIRKTQRCVTSKME